MRLNAIIIEKILPTVSILIRIANTIATEIRMSNIYLVWKWNHCIVHQLQVKIELYFLN